MKRIFHKKSTTLQFRLLIAIIFSIITIIADTRNHAFAQIHNCLDSSINLLYLIKNHFTKTLDCILETINQYKEIKLENTILRQELLFKKNDLILLKKYKQENEYLHELLKSPVDEHEEKMLANVVMVTKDPYANQLLINKGNKNGVHVGQIAINEKGIIGQVISVAQTTSRILLICDTSHALPVRILRNNIRMIVSGRGSNKDLKLLNVLPNTDIRIGDTLVTSGLDERFPEGYPVALVSSIKINSKGSYIQILAKPIAKLQQLQNILLVWHTANIKKVKL